MRVWITILINSKFPIGSNFEFYCFTDFVDLYSTGYMITGKFCYRNNQQQNINEIRNYKRYFIWNITGLTDKMSGNYFCQLKLCLLNKCILRTSCNRTIQVLKPMSVVAFNYSSAIAGNNFSIYFNGFPGDFWRQTQISLNISDNPTTWTILPPLYEATYRNSTNIIINITVRLSETPEFYSTVILCYSMYNNKNLPEIVGECKKLDVIHVMRGILTTTPSFQNIVKIQTKLLIKCHGMIGYPKPKYYWLRLSRENIRFLSDEIPDLKVDNDDELIVGTSVKEQGHYYKYQCSSVQINTTVNLIIEFIVNLCEHEPIMDLYFAVNTQIHTTCSINNKQGQEFFGVIYKPLLQQLFKALPITPKKTRVRLIPFLNYRKNSNCSWLSWDKSQTANDLIGSLDKFTSQYNSADALPCDGMELACAGQGFSRVYNRLDRSRSPDIPRIVIIARDTSACQDYNENLNDLKKFSKLFHENNLKIWLQYFSLDIDLLKQEEIFIRPNNTFIMTNTSFKQHDLGLCCDMSKFEKLFATSSFKFQRALCEISGKAKDPQGNPEIRLLSTLIYSNLIGEVVCTGNPGYPNGQLKLCIAQLINQSPQCLYALTNISIIYHNSSNWMTVSQLVSFNKTWHGKYLVCISTNSIQSENFDPIYSDAILIDFEYRSMFIVKLKIVNDFIVEGDTVFINCSFNLPLPLPFVRIYMKNTEQSQQENLYSARFNISSDMKIIESFMLQYVVVFIPNIINKWDESKIICQLKNSQEELSDVETLLIDKSKVRQPILSIRTGEDYEMNSSIFNTSRDDNNVEFLQQNNWLMVNCSGYVGNYNNSLTFTIVGRSGPSRTGDNTLVWLNVTNDQNECMQFTGSIYVTRQQVICSEQRSITRNEDFRQIIVIVPCIPSGDAAALEISCIAQNTLNKLSAQLQFKIYRSAQIVSFAKQRNVIGYSIICKATGQPEVDIALTLLETIPNSIFRQTSYLPQSIDVLNSSSKSITVNISIPISGILRYLCQASNRIKSQIYKDQVNQAFLFVNESSDSIQFKVEPSIINNVNTTTQMSCILMDLNLTSAVTQLMIYIKIQSRLMRKLSDQLLPVLVNSNIRTKTVTKFGLWNNSFVDIIDSELINNTWKFVWKLTLNMTKRSLSGRYVCGVRYMNQLTDLSSNNNCSIDPDYSNLIVSEPPSNLKFFLQKDDKNRTLTHTVTIDDWVYLVCAAHLDVYSVLNGWITLCYNTTINAVHKITCLPRIIATHTNLIDDSILVYKYYTQVTLQYFIQSNWFCKASNNLGITTHLLTQLTILYKPITIRIKQFSLYTHILNFTDHLECLAEANPPANYIWSVLQAPHPSYKSIIVNSSVLNLSVFTRLPLPLTDGLFHLQCLASNFIGSISTSKVAFVVLPDTLTSNHSMQHQPEMPETGSTLHLYCLPFITANIRIQLHDLIDYIDWYKILPTGVHQTLIKYHFQTREIDNNVNNSRFFIRGPYNVFRMDIINITIADYGYYGCKVKLTSQVKIVDQTQYPVCILVKPDPLHITPSSHCVREQSNVVLNCVGNTGRIICEFSQSNSSFFHQIKLWLIQKFPYEQPTSILLHNYSLYQKENIQINQQYNITQISSSFNGTEYSCLIQSELSIGRIIQWNISSVFNTVICVEYPPKNMRIEPEISQIKPGSLLNCIVEANPYAQIKIVPPETSSDWRVLPNRNERNSGWMLISPNEKPGHFTIICSATNQINQELFSISNAYTIRIVPIADNNWMNIIILLLIIIFTVILLFVFIWIIWRFGRGIFQKVQSSKLWKASKLLVEDDESDVDTEESIYNDSEPPEITNEDLQGMLDYFLANPVEEKHSIFEVSKSSSNK